jgi:3-oxoacyl-[acyl-carrier protein] reductase
MGTASGFEGPVALVTGSRKGLGKYLATELIRCGYHVVGCSREAADWTLENYCHVQADVSDAAQVKALLEQVRERFQRLDVTINSAGIASMNHSLLMPPETVSRIMNVNFCGTFLVSRESAKLMRQRRFGRIVNITSVAVPMCLAGESAYAASKAAIENLTRVMARELAEFGITVNAVGPSPIETDLIKGVPREKIDAIVGQLAIKRLGQPRDVFNVIEFLIRSSTDYVTGQLIYLGGP